MTPKRYTLNAKRSNQSGFTPLEITKTGGQSCRQKRNSLTGFTLIEVMITVFIVALVLGLVFSTLYITALSSKSLMSKSKRYSDIMKVYFQMREQLISLYKSGNSPYMLKGSPGAQEKSDSLYLITAAPSIVRGVTEVQYEMKKDEKGNTYLAYRELPYPGHKTADTSGQNDKNWEVLSKKITGLKLDYAKGNLWFTEWDKEEPPEAVRVTLYYNEEGIEQKFTFSAVPGTVELEQVLSGENKTTENTEN